jgi:hypothetical protein
MTAMSLSQFRTAVSGFQGHSFVTLAREQPFVLQIEPDALAFAIATGKVRRESWNQVERVLERFAQTESFQPSKYVDVTHNASYVLKVLKVLLQDK